MSQAAFADRQSPEYLKLVEDRTLLKRFGKDYPDVKWLNEFLIHLKSTPPDLDYTDKDYADIEKAMPILRRILCKAAQSEADDSGPDWQDDGDADDGGGKPASGENGQQQAPNSAAEQRAMAIYGESAGLTPRLNNPDASPYNPLNWNPNSTDMLAEARAYIGIVSERNPNVNFADPPSSGNPIDIRAWNDSLASAVDGYNSNDLNPNVTNFFLRQDGVGVQIPPWPGLTLYVSLGPFNNVGGGDVPRGPDTYIDFYGKGQ